MRGGLTRNLSLISGLILFAFAATHFLNHAVGLFNLELMDQVQGWRLAMTRSWPGVIILAAALVFHIVFGLLKLLGRRTLKLPAWELAQLLLGLAIPFLLLPHIIDTHVASSLFGVQDSYLYELARLWPSSALSQSLLLAIVWAHGCLGIHHWLKVRTWYRALAAAAVADRDRNSCCCARRLRCVGTRGCRPDKRPGHGRAHARADALAQFVQRRHSGFL